VPELTVSLPLWIASQVAMAIALFFGLSCFQIKRKKYMLLVLGVSCIFEAICAALLLNWVIFGIACVATTRSFTFAFFEFRRARGLTVNPIISNTILALFMAAAIIAVGFTWTWWFDWLMLGAALAIIVGNWNKGIHLIRLSCLVYDVLIIVNHVIFFNLVGILFSALMICSVIIFYIRFFYKRPKKDLDQNAPV